MRPVVSHCVRLAASVPVAFARWRADQNVSVIVTRSNVIGVAGGELGESASGCDRIDVRIIPEAASQSMVILPFGWSIWLRQGCVRSLLPPNCRGRDLSFQPLHPCKDAFNR